MVSSLLCCHRPSFWASHSGQTGLRQREHYIFDNVKVKLEPSVQNQYRSAIETWSGKYLCIPYYNVFKLYYKVLII